MSGKKFDLIGTLFSVVGALIPCVIILYYRVTGGFDSPEVLALFVGLLLAAAFLCGYGMFRLYLLLFKKYKILESKKLLLRLGIVALLIFIIGSAGQYLFMIDTKTDVSDSEANVIFAIDMSGSLKDYDESRETITKEFINCFNEKSQMMLLPFGGTIIERCVTEFLPMTQDNKDLCILLETQLISSGITNYDIMLDYSYEVINNYAPEGKKPVVVVLSDAVGDVSDEIKTKYDKDNIQVFSIQMSKGDNGAKASFADFAKDTGGKNIKIDIGSDNSIDKEQILQAYALITLSDISTDFILNTELSIFSTLDVGFIKHLSRLVFFVVLMVLASIGQFGRPDKKSLILNILLGCVAFVVVSIIGGVIFNFVNKAEIYNASLIFCGGFFVVCQGMILVFTSSQGDDCLNV